jgi:hypothetical protein
MELAILTIISSAGNRNFLRKYKIKARYALSFIGQSKSMAFIENRLKRTILEQRELATYLLRTEIKFIRL